MRIIHLTDVHLVAPGGHLFGLDPLARLDWALDHIRRHEPEADHLLLTGDLTDRGEPAAYAALAERLRGFEPPSLLLMGNHDERAAFRSAFPDAPSDAQGFVQQAIDGEDGVSLVTLDTLLPGSGKGELCAERLAWLDAVLGDRRDRAVYLAMHHPPVDCGIPGMDEIGLVSEPAFWEVIDRHPQVRHVFSGHIHRPFFASRGHVGISTVPGPAQQVHLQFICRDAVLGSLEAGAYGIAELHRDRFWLHIQSFTDTSRRFVFDDASNRASSPEAMPPVPERYASLL